MFQDIYRNEKIQNKSLKGYTLMEILVAMSIFVAIAVCLSLPFSNSINLSVNDQNIANANNLARKYLKTVESNWQSPSNYEAGNCPDKPKCKGVLPGASEYTAGNRYKVTVNEQDITNSDDIVVLKRVNLEYRNNKNNNVLANIFSDFSKPEPVVK